MEEKKLSKYFVGEGEMWQVGEKPGQVELQNLKLLCNKVLDPIREAANKPLHVSSGYRPLSRNLRAGGAKKSQHLYGKAADIYCPTITGLDLFLIAAKQATVSARIGAIGLYHDPNRKGKFIHVDTRDRVSGRVTVWYCDANGNYVALPKAYMDLLTAVGLKVVTIGGIQN